MPSKTTYELETIIATLNAQIDGFTADTYAKDRRIVHLENKLAELRKAGLHMLAVYRNENKEPGWVHRYTKARDEFVLMCVSGDAASVAQANKEQGNG